jgi:hypothetical protein
MSCFEIQGTSCGVLNLILFFPYYIFFIIYIFEWNYQLHVVEFPLHVVVREIFAKNKIFKTNSLTIEVRSSPLLANANSLIANS